MSGTPWNPDIARYNEELNVYALYMEDTTYVCDVIPPTEEIPVPVLAVELEEGDEGVPPLAMYYMFVEPEQQDDDEDDDIFGHTEYLQVISSIPVSLPEDETLLDIFLFCSAANQNMPLGNVFISPDKQVAYRYVFAVDKEVGLTREVFLETLFVMHFLVEQLYDGLRPLASGEVTFEQAIAGFAGDE